MTYKRLLKKNLGTNLHKLEIFRRSILPIGFTQKIPKKFQDAIQPSNNNFTKLQHLIFPSYLAKKSNSASALGVHKPEKTITTKTNITHNPLNESTICLCQIINRLSSYTPTNFQQLSSRKFPLI
jgi:hypothetical protein